ncbi:MAG: MCE family protein [Bacteroidales bacterium]|nr:MAG: MCE family protein [Bacteroidales bacterium]
MKIRNEVKIGLLAVVTIALFTWGYNFMKGKNLLKTSRSYSAIYNNIDGLEESNGVWLSGYRIGLVNNIRFLSDNSGRILVGIIIQEDIDLPKNSVAQIYPADVMGTRAIRIILGDSEEICQSGDTLTAAMEGGLQDQVKKEILPLKDKAENLIQSLDSVLVIVQTTFDKEFKESFTESFTHLQKTTYTLDTMLTNEEGRIAHVLSNMESISSNLQENNEELTAIFQNISTISDSLARSNIRSTVDNLDRTLANMDTLLTRINRGEGTVGMLMANDTLYQYLENTAKSLNDLLKDLKENPKKYVNVSVFGGRSSK